MTYSLSEELPKSRVVILILAFGDLSRLEACTVLSSDIVEVQAVCGRLSILKLSEPSKKFQRLAGIHKLAIPHNASFSADPGSFRDEIVEIFGATEKKLNFSVSLYCGGERDAQEYETIVSTVLQAVRQAGFKKANLLRPHAGTELLAKDVLARNALDMVVYPSGGEYSTGTTVFVPSFEDVSSRATSRPVVSSEISLSPRLAKLLVNLSSLPRGSLLLDPFCGAGTILAEAALQGINCMGIDRNPSRVVNAEKNLTWISREYTYRRPGSHVIEVGDVSNLPNILKGKEVDAVVTEPILLPRFTSMPGLKKAKDAINRASRIYSSALYSISEVVKKGGRIVLVAPSIRTHEGKEVSITLQGLEEVGLKEFQPRRDMIFSYPIRLAFESTRWVKRLVYVFEHV